jgi:hypothetical protein
MQSKAKINEQNPYEIRQNNTTNAYFKTSEQERQESLKLDPKVLS